MTITNTNFWNPSPNVEEAGSLKKSEYLNLPDLQFYLWCQNHYKLNKGVYNTIDSWFFENGLRQIIPRRIHMLAFLDYAKIVNPFQGEHKYIRFGHGGLTKKLQEFMTHSEKKKEN